MADSTNKKSCLCNVLPAVVLLGLVFFIRNTFVANDYNERISKWEMIEVDPLPITQSDNRCKDRRRSHGTDLLPKGIIGETSNLEMQPLWGFPKKKPLATCMHKLQTAKMAIGLQISESWLHEYQVLPSRTHPFMQMSASGGYILSGIRICSNETFL